MSTDVFISYRRHGASTLANILHKMLKEKGLNVFFDSAVIEAGASFGDQILTPLKEAKNFLLLVSPGFFDRCKEPNDWVTKEIANAITPLAGEEKKTILLALVNGFKKEHLPKSTELPEEIAAITAYEAIELNERNFDVEFNRLIQAIQIERHDRLVNAFIDSHDPEDETHVGWIAGTLLRYTKDGKKDGKNAITICGAEIKKRWGGEITHLELESYDFAFIQSLCEKLGIKPYGRTEHMIKCITAWINKNEKGWTPNEIDANTDFRDISYEIFKTTLDTISKDRLIEICRTAEIAFDGRSAEDMRNKIHDAIDLDIEQELSLLDSMAVRKISDKTINSKVKKKEFLIQILTKCYETNSIVDEAEWTS